jgi:hypothetical protein
MADLYFDPIKKELFGRIGGEQFKEHADSGGHATSTAVRADWRANNIFSAGKYGGVIPGGAYRMLARSKSRSGKIYRYGCIWLESDSVSRLWGRDGLLIHVRGGKDGSIGCIVVESKVMQRLYSAVDGGGGSVLFVGGLVPLSNVVGTRTV